MNSVSVIKRYEPYHLSGQPLAATLSFISTTSLFHVIWISEILQSPKVKEAIAKTPISEADAGDLLKSLVDAASKDTRL